MIEAIWNMWAESVLKGFVGGAAAYFVQWLLRGGESRLERLQTHQPESNDYEEELLAHFVESVQEQIEATETLTIGQSFKLIRLRANVLVVCFYMKVPRFPEDGEDIRDI